METACTCRSTGTKRHDEECWWEALEATAKPDGNPASPTPDHINRAILWRRAQDKARGLEACDG